MQDVVGEFETLVLPDRRLTERARSFLRSAFKKPSASLPEMLENVAGLEGAYRLVNNERVSFADLTASHQAKTAERAQEVGDVVVAHDTSDIETRYADAAKVGYLNTGKSGYRLHLSLAMQVMPRRAVRPLGVLCAQPVFRPKKPKRGGRKRRGGGAQTSRWKHKESARWEQGVVASADALGDACSVVHVMDREADSYPLFCAIGAVGHDFVTRLRNDRKARLDDEEEDDGDDEWSFLSALAINLKGVLSREVPLSKRGAKQLPAQFKCHPQRSARCATLHFAAVRVEVRKPHHLPSAKFPESLSLYMVRVWEPDPPEGEDRVDWVLITNQVCETTEQIERVVDLYRSRWTIEEYFKALKTGCAIEERQFESSRALINTLAIFLPIAVHLLWLRCCARDEPDADATEIFTELQLTVLRHRSHRRLPEKPTAQQALWVLAGIGGHIPNNGPPGWIVLGRAFAKLLEAVAVWKLATEASLKQAVI